MELPWTGSSQVLDWYVYTRFVAIRSREGKHFRHAGSAVAESRPIFTAAVVLLGSLITRTRRQATRYYLLFRRSIARSQVRRHCLLRALIEPVVFQVSEAVEKSPDNATGCCR